MKIILVCSSGISSGLLMRRISKIAESNNRSEYQITSIGYEALNKMSDSYDLVLIAPIGSNIINKTIEICNEKNMRYLVLNHDDYVGINAQNIFNTMEKILGE